MADLKKDHVKEVLAKDLPEDQFPHEYMKFIKPEDYDKKVFYVEYHINNPNKTTAGMEINKLLNYRYVFKQLEIDFPKTDIRDLWYYIQTLLRRKYKIGMDMGFKSFESAVGGGTYSSKLYKHLGYEYWGYVYDYLKITPAEVIVAYEPNLIDNFLLNTKTIQKIAKTPFFLIISEKKEILVSVMEELYEKGYREGYYGINLGKVATSYGIKLIIELSNIRNFHVFVLHDLDMSGLKIFLDMKKWIKRATIESIGVNTEFLKFVNIKFDDVCEGYKASKTETKGVRRVIKELRISEEQKEIYKNWAKDCLVRKIELNSIIAHRILEDITKPKARDYVDYLIQKIEAKNWNLTRVKDFTRKQQLAVGNYKPSNYIHFDYARTPSIVWDISSKKENIFRKKQEAFTTELEQIISDVGYGKYYRKWKKIEERIYNIKRAERDNISSKLYKFKKELPEIFDIDWSEILEKRIGYSLEMMGSTVEGIGKIYDLKSVRGFLKYKKELSNYNISIKENDNDLDDLAMIVKNKKIKWINQDITGYEKKGKKIIRETFYKIIDRQMKKSDEYKTAKEKSVELLKEFDEQAKEIKTDERMEILEAFRSEMDEMFENLSNELDKLEGEND